MKAAVIFLTALLAAACMAAEVPQSAADVQPLHVGDSVPDVLLRTAQGDSFSLQQETAGQPAVLIFYRGGWCPYCNRHLAALQQVEQQLLELGFRLLAISPDQPAKLAETAEKDNVSYLLLSDSSMGASRAFGIAFRLDDATFKKYKEEYGIDIEADSGQTHHQLPVPAVFITDATGRIGFAHFNPDYKTRLDPEAVVSAAQRIRQENKQP